MGSALTKDESAAEPVVLITAVMAAGDGGVAMHDLAHLAWRVYPAVALMLCGLFLTMRAWRRCRNAWPRPLSDAMQPLLWMRGFRLAIVGLALSGIGAAWLWQIGWLLAVSLVVVAEETLETSIAIAALSSE